MRGGNEGEREKEIREVKKVIKKERERKQIILNILWQKNKLYLYIVL